MTSKAVVFSSPNVREDLKFEEATRLLHSDEQARTAKIYAEQAEQLGLTVSICNAIGDWSDGAENTIYSEVSNAKSYEDVETLAAMHGLVSNQKTVLPFFETPDGNDALYRITIPRGNSTEIRKSLDEEGLPYRTMVVRRDSVQIVIFDKNSTLKANVTRFASMCRARPDECKGYGNFLGGPTRTEGKAAYRKILKYPRPSNWVRSRAGGTVTKLDGFAGLVLLPDN